MINLSTLFCGFTFLNGDRIMGDMVQGNKRYGNRVMGDMVTEEWKTWYRVFKTW